MSKSAAFCALLLSMSLASAQMMDEVRKCDTCLLLGQELNKACRTAKPAKLPVEAWTEALIDDSVSKASSLYVWAQPQGSDRGWYKEIDAALSEYGDGSLNLRHSLNDGRVDHRRKSFLAGLIGEHDEAVEELMALCDRPDGPGNRVSLYALASVLCKKLCDPTRLNPELKTYPDAEVVAHRAQFISEHGSYKAVYDSGSNPEL
ncbi:hypothetical protein DIPPA_30152 [Diplonema papillatum]|nr:hypothetical protein DIPPA_30152 [Diplonema papillatum]